jgi:galactose mutarotase-like enzyme
LKAAGRKLAAKRDASRPFFVLETRMPATTWKIIDDKNLVRQSQPFRAAGNSSQGAWSVTGRGYEDGLRAGVDVVAIDNGRLRLDVVPTRGMGIHRIGINGDQEVPAIGWKSPVHGPVHPAFVDLGEPSGLGWLDGFDEFFVRCGLESNGAPEFDAKTGRLAYPLHGRIANKPASDVQLTVDPDKQEIAISGVVEEARFHFLKLRMRTTISTKLGSSSFTVRDEVINVSTVPATMQMLYHINFGLPLLDAGSRVIAPVKTLVPRTARAASAVKAWDSYSAPEPGFDEMVYFFELNAAEDGSTQTLIKNAHSTRGVSLSFNKKQLPWFSLWKDTAGEADGYVTGLEPGTNFPNPRSFEKSKDREVKLAPGQTQTFEIRVEVHGNADEVKNAEAAVAKIQAGRQPKIFYQPQADWVAPG